MVFSNKEPDKKEDKLLRNKYPLYLTGTLIAWTIVVLLSFIWTFNKEKQTLHDIAMANARTHYRKDVAIRAWAASHGGIYVPISKNTQPSPFLSHIPERDITTASGKSLTLMNPAFLFRQLNDEFKSASGTYSHVTSLKPLRPQNFADAWESESLKTFENGQSETFTYTTIKGHPYLRMMRPVITKKSCLKCHGTQGYKEGDIRGGISVSIPIEKMNAQFQNHLLDAGMNHSLIWILFSGFLIWGSRQFYKKVVSQNAAEKRIDEIEKQQQLLFEKLSIGVFRSTPEATGQFIHVNSSLCSMTGYTSEELLQLPLSELFLDPTEQTTFFEMITLDSTLEEHEIKIERRDGSYFWAGMSANRIRKPDNSCEYIDVFVRDISEKHEDKEHLRQNMEELERFNQIAMDREMRIFELKREINILLEKQGLEKKYLLEIATARFD